MTYNPDYRIAANHDDRALYHYLRSGRGRTPGKLFYAAGRPIIAVAENGRGNHWSQVVEQYQLAMSRFLTDEELLVAAPIPPVSPWSKFLFYYANARSTPPDVTPGLLNKNMSRSVLLKALQADKDNAFWAIKTGFTPELQRFFLHKFPTAGLEFDDILQDTLFAFFKKPPDPDREHTAQLYTIFRSIFYNKAVDRLKLDNRQLPENEIIEIERNNSTNFADYIIEENQLNDLFATDDEVKLVHKAIDKLEANCQKIIKLRFIRGLKMREIAELLDHSTNSMGKRVQRCLAHLQKIFSHN